MTGRGFDTVLSMAIIKAPLWAKRLAKRELVWLAEDVAVEVQKGARIEDAWRKKKPPQ